LSVVLVGVTACSRQEAPPAVGSAASPATLAANRAVAEALPLAEAQDFEDARRGFIAKDDPLVIRRADGVPVWDFASFGFIDGDAPGTVNPSLWRQARLNGQYGLFEVVPGIHQVRGYDISNMTLIEGKSGWIVVDPLTVEETAAAALALARKHLGDRPVSAVIFTHSHVDHFGGVEGVLPADPAAAERIPIVAPLGFIEEATSENVLAGVAMGRRASFMYGQPLPRNPTGHVDTGLGKGPPSGGKVSIREPTVIVDRTAAGARGRRRQVRLPVHAGIGGARGARVLPA